jgi:hypothetical protein
VTWNNPEGNPYDPTSPNYTPETPPLDQVIRQAIQAAVLSLRVHLPASITVVRGNQKVDVQPLLKTRYIDGQVANLPVIQNVPVQMLVGQNYSIKVPIAVGDTGSLLFCDRSLDVWLSGGGGLIDPQDSRAHDLSDPVFIPGLVPFSSQTTDATNDLVVTNKNAQLRLTQGGGFKIQSLKSSQELINILTTLVQTLSTASTVAGGPFTPDVVTTLTQMVQNLETLQG